MLRSKGLTSKLLLLGIDGMDPRFTKRLIEEGKLPNVQKRIELGSCREDLMTLGANPTITPPMWATLGTGCYPMTHGIMDYNLSAENDRDITIGAFSSRFLKVEPLWNVTATAGKKTLVMHWPGGSFPPTCNSENLYTIDGSSPGAVCAWSSVRDFDMIFIASTKTEQPSYMPYSAVTSEFAGDEKLSFVLKSSKSGTTPEAKTRLEKYKQWYKDYIDVEGYTPDLSFVVDTVLFEKDQGLNWSLADFPSSCSLSPVMPATGWSFDIPADAKEFVMITYYGKVMRNGLILKNDQGVYDKVAIYNGKSADKPVVVLENDVFTPAYDTIPKADGGEELVYRNMRLLKIAQDGSYVRIWSSRGMSCEDDSVWFPRSLFKEITDAVGPLQPSSQMIGNDADLIMKCNNPQWELSAKWQSDCMYYMIDKYAIDVIFSHFHNIDMQSHNYMKYMKNRKTSRYDESEILLYAEAAYKITDDYLGSFMHLLDEG